MALNITGFAHPRCYAAKTRDCSEIISNEHYISKSVLLQLSVGNETKMTGLSWLPYQEMTSVSPNALTANVLCKRHNEILSPLDDEASQFFRTLNNMAKMKHVNSQISYDGEKIERWLLKVICGIIAAKQVIRNRVVRGKVTIKDIYLDILFNNQKWPKDWGLYFKDSNQFHPYPGSLSILPVSVKDDLKGVEFLLNNFDFALVLYNLRNKKTFGIYRPSEINFYYHGLKSGVSLSWANQANYQTIDYEFSRLTQALPKNWEPWMRH